MFGPGGQVLLDKMILEGIYGLKVESLRDLLELYNRELTMVEREIRCSKTTADTRPSRPSAGSGR